MEELTNNTTTAWCCSLLVTTPIAHGISGLFVFSAILITCFQVFQHLRYYTVPDQQLWIVRILFIIPVYGFCSWIGILFPRYSVYFDAIRSCYEAFVIYNFMRLCIAYVGGESAILASLNGTPIQRSCLSGTCCFPKMTFSIRYLRFCIQATLQFCFVKPFVAVVTIILEAVHMYHEGNWDPKYGYIYCTFAYNISVTLALYGLVLFYTAAKPLLSNYKPVLKFFCIKSIVFLSFWQGLLLAILYWVGVIQTAENAATYQNFLITIEMFVAAMLLFFAFPYAYYRSLCKDPQGRGIPMQDISSHFRQTLNPHDVVNDAIHNFSRVYQQYAIQGDLSEEEQEERDRNAAVAGGDGKKKSSPYSFKSLGKRKEVPPKGYEKTVLLVESDEDEIF